MLIVYPHCEHGCGILREYQFIETNRILEIRVADNLVTTMIGKSPSWISWNKIIMDSNKKYTHNTLFCV